MSSKFSSPRILLTDQKDLPNPMFSDMHKDGRSGLWVPNKTTSMFDEMTFPSLFDGHMFTRFWGMGFDESKPAPADDVPFELNMVQALEGWRAWKFESGKLVSIYTHNGKSHVWNPDVSMSATCKESHAVPAQHCTCGLYAGDDFEAIKSYVEDDGDRIVFGRVSGWGRYVRGDAGWRAQFCYPKSFHILQGTTPDELESLKLFHVPIFMDQPVLMYNPQEDGYEYGDDEADRNFRASASSNADEEDDED